MGVRTTEVARRTRTPFCYCVIIALLLFSTISLPVGSPVGSAVGSILASVPGISVVSEVDTFSLTQVRYSDLNAIIPLAFVALSALVLLNGKSVLRLRINAMSAGFLVFAFVAALSACLFHEYVEALKLIVYVLIVVSYLSFDDSDRACVRDALVAMCFVAGILNAVVTICQYGSMSGWVFTPSTIRLYRPDGLFGDSIISALMCDVCIAAAFFRESKASLFVRVTAVILCVVAGIVTGARSFYYLLGVVGAYLLLAKTANVPLKIKGLLVLGVLAIVAFVVSPIGQSLIDSLTIQESVSSRELKQQIALEQFSGAPILGIGTGQYANVEASLNAPANSGLHGTNPHNVYLQVLCENGLVGFIPFVVSAAALFVLAMKRKNSFAVILLLLYFAIAWSLGILYSVAFTSFLVALVSALLCQGEKNE